MSRFRAILASAFLTLTAVGWFAMRDMRPVDALIAPAPCVGNVCTGAVSIGGKSVAYAYTQHIASGGQFRIRFNGGVYNTAGLVSFIVHDAPAFSTAGYQANTGAFAMTESDVNPGSTAYERRDSNGCINCTYDHVLSLQYGAMPAGAYAFSFTVIQNGDSGGRIALPFYVDAGAPSNGDESLVWNALSGMDAPCADGIDNDIDFIADCGDAQCAGSIGQVATGAVCELPELTCNDGFDNDADGLPDCLDQSCDGLVGQPSGTALCQYGNEFGVSTCGDTFDNDGDGRQDCVDNLFDAAKGGNANTICWKKLAYSCPEKENCATPIDDDKDMSYSDDWDDSPTTGINCTDYDCAGNLACPSVEHKTAAGVEAEEQCFDGDDNDLDHLIDCADIDDCRGVVNPNNSSQVCFDKEFDLGQRYQYCGNTFDDDGDGPMDCADSDCARRFGSCGPCPSREDFTYSACADAKDNDTDGAVNCADPNCAGKLGALSGAAMCAVESGSIHCADGFDNDLDGTKDCADPGCAGAAGPLGAVCQASEVAPYCGDQKDNDGDGRIDCADVDCAGQGACAAKTWADASCVSVPGYSAPTTFTSSTPTVTAVVQTAVHVNDVDALRFVGGGTYSSVTMIVGDNTAPAKYYPYAADTPGCTLVDTATGLGAARFSFTAVAGSAVQIFNTPGPDIVGFDITLRCATPATPAAIKGYPVSISVLKSPDDVPEYGDVEFTTTLYEAVAPSIAEIEMEGVSVATVSVPYGGVAPAAVRRVRAVPSDPAVSSGICACDVEIDGASTTTGASCITAGASYLSDTVLSVRARATDGAGNEGAWSGMSLLGINVTPTEMSPLVISPSAPFFRTNDKSLGIDVRFITGGSDTFGATCGIYLYPEGSTTPVFAPGPTLTMANSSAINSVMICQGDVNIPDSIPDGRYDVVVRATDAAGDAVDSIRKTMYWCDDVPTVNDPEPTNGCQYADFDRDGAPEGLYAFADANGDGATDVPKVGLYSTDVKSCDNCINLANSSQLDANANGIGDDCEPTEQYGRCEIDKQIVCTADADTTPFPDDGITDCVSGDLCCPAPAELDGTTYGQQCVTEWGICTLGGEICLVDAECPGGQGACELSGDSCYQDTECPSGEMCLGADRCDSLLYPWVQTLHGSIYSGKKISANEAPPNDQFNATFCITAKDSIVNFVSEGLGSCGAVEDAAARYSLPNASNAYSGVLGKLDVDGLRNGRYGQVIIIGGASTLDEVLTDYSDSLGGKVFRVVGDATVGAHVFKNGATDGSGTIFVDGGNLTVTGNVTYDTDAASSPEQIASVGWIVIDNGTGTKGNVYVDRAVTTFSGAVYAGGQEGFWSVAPPEADGPLPLVVNGMVLAREFRLSRSYKSSTQASETFVYDGRAVVNPPPGFADLSRALPTIGQ